jgi:hypothetical protein
VHFQYGFIDVAIPTPTISNDKRAASILAGFMLDDNSAMYHVAPKNTMRGIDFYPPTLLIPVIGNVLDIYQRKTGEPAADPSNAILLSEKILWSKFFRPIAIPTVADKLTAYSALPLPLRQHIKRPKVIWQSKNNVLPANDEIPPGHYVLKANHGAGMFAEVSYPLDESARSRLEEKTSAWLHKTYNFTGGEWWYATISPQLLLERKLDFDDDALSEFKFFIIDGRLTHFHAYLPKQPRVGTCIYDRNLNFLDIKIKGRENHAVTLPRRIHELCALAEQAAAEFDFVRVDLYLDRHEEVWFSELTLAPEDGYGRYSSREFEADVGAQWDISAYL